MKMPCFVSVLTMMSSFSSSFECFIGCFSAREDTRSPYNIWRATDEEEEEEGRRER